MKTWEVTVSGLSCTHGLGGNLTGRTEHHIERPLQRLSWILKCIPLTMGFSVGETTALMETQGYLILAPYK